jgi:hypothetical protein
MLSGAETGGTIPVRARRSAGGRRSTGWRHRGRFHRPGRHIPTSIEKASCVPNYGVRQRSRFQLPDVGDRQRSWTRFPVPRGLPSSVEQLRTTLSLRACGPRNPMKITGDQPRQSLTRQPAQQGWRAGQVPLRMSRFLWVLHLCCRRLTRSWAKDRASDALMWATSSSESLSLRRASARCRASSALASSILSA